MTYNPTRALELLRIGSGRGDAVFREGQEDATFDPKDHGRANFADMVKAMESIVEIKKGETDHLLRVR